VTWSTWSGSGGLTSLARAQTDEEELYYLQLMMLQVQGGLQRRFGPSYIPTTFIPTRVVRHVLHHPRRDVEWTGEPGRKGTRSTDFYKAWWFYTGIPSAAAGGGAALGTQVLWQAPQARWFSPFMRMGFFTAWALEASIGTAIFSLLFTLVDPAHKWEGGLDETDWYQSQSAESRLSLWSEAIMKPWMAVKYPHGAPPE